MTDKTRNSRGKTDGDLSSAAIKFGLGTEIIGKTVYYYPRVTSTMDVARRKAGAGAPEGTVIIAGQQSAGRGRLKRTWLTMKGNVAVSVILYPDITALPGLIMLASMAVTAAIEAVTGLDTRIKWPNDVLIRGKKVAGILIENEVKGSGKALAVIGIGINLNLKTINYPEISATATSLDSELDKEVSSLELVRQLLRELGRYYLLLRSPGTLYEVWKEKLITLGKKVLVTTGGSVIEGFAESVEKDGSLNVRLGDGSIINVVAGDVMLRET